jgi:methylmalonyl-CoA epimerase
MIKKINHIAIIVKDIEQALIPYRDCLGLKPTEIEYLESFNVKVVFLPVGDTQIELVQPLGQEGELNDFLRTTGGGLHHIALETDDVGTSLTEIEKFGIRMKDRSPRPGAHDSTIAFVEQSEFDGVIIELVQPLNKLAHS